MSSTSTPQATPVHATWLRRIAALCVDWAASSLVVIALVGGWDSYQREPGLVWITTLVFWLESAIGVALGGGSFGQMLVRVRVHRTDGRPLSLLRALQRQLLVCLVIPPLVFREDGRGLHDLWTHSGAYQLR